MSITLICGGMWSGKTNHMDAQLERCHSIGLKVARITYTHSNDRSVDERTCVNLPNSILKYDMHELCIHNEEFMHIINKIDVIGIDEAHFFDAVKFKQFIMKVASLQKKIYVCGLNGDKFQEPFRTMSDIIPIVDDIIYKKALCIDCKDGTPALFSVMHSCTTDELKCVNVIGGSDKYKPVCRKHLIDMKKENPVHRTLD